ncbi:MAG: large conductance mechanosensitive channel protein MscL [Actinomyces sp.]|jgi:large conductance mechanosensitive channel|nr:large conductance mechanosensitive channel protein MscL [Actinomyces sp.]MCI1663006.1 large conductance mechanosensitive channel protein MscL [Actinomyces sp.]MCI1788463.1 large conductance mechanosensitive channel protein MscL [Actinomyces sp.]MCI1831015.1 large conductance mechanosensitive channel protein MscL [Actinomyces sp.]
MIQGFKDFISRGNAIDLAVGVIIGGAFSTIVTALVEKVINPLIGALVGKPNFDNWGEFTLGTGANQAVVQPGVVLTALVNFLLVALALYFFLVVPMNRLAARRAGSGEDEEEAPETSDETRLLTEIRDLLAGSGTDAPTASGAPRH